MKKLITFSLLIVLAFSLQAQVNRVDQLQNLEKGQPANQSDTLTATLKNSTRLFGAKEDLTTVITIIPSGSIVDILDSDSTYFYVLFNEDEGYIYKRDAVINNQEQTTSPNIVYEEAAPQQQPAQRQQVNRFSFLESKYGSNVAARLMAGKIWKGMNPEMVTDSWGRAEKINRVISGNLIKEEWIYNNTWLYFENDMLVEWGPIKK
jgi:hypothetical protein